MAAAMNLEPGWLATKPAKCKMKARMLQIWASSQSSYDWALQESIVLTRITIFFSTHGFSLVFGAGVVHSPGSSFNPYFAKRARAFSSRCRMLAAALMSGFVPAEASGVVRGWLSAKNAVPVDDGSPGASLELTSEVRAERGLKTFEARRNILVKPCDSLSPEPLPLGEVMLGSSLDEQGIPR